MSTMYGKVFESMYDGTLATTGPWQALVTFQQMIVLADKDGVVDMTANAISRRTSIPMEIIETGIAALMRPDPESRSSAEDGRRIVGLSDNRTWGWQIVNYVKYSALRSAEERREYMRQAQAEHRAKVKASKNVMTNSDNGTFVNTSTDVPVPVPVDVKKKEEGGVAQARPPLPAYLGDENEGEIPKKATIPLAAKWELPEAWGNDIVALGWKPADILRESEKFRQYWTVGAGTGTRRSVKGWRQSWSNWTSKAEKYGIRRVA